MAQLTFWSVVAGGSVGLALFFYPGVQRHAASTKDAWLASAMAAVLCATTIALAAGTLVNVVVRWMG